MKIIVVLSCIYLVGMCIYLGILDHIKGKTKREKGYPGL